MDQENYICKACRQPEIVTTVPSYSYDPNQTMQYVKTQQQLYNNKWKGKEIISLHADSPFRFKEQSDLTLRTMIGAGRKNTRPKKLIRLKGKRISNHLHNNQLHSKLREMSKLLKTRGELLNRPISSLEILSQVNHDESDTQGLTLVRRKKRKTRRKWKGRGFMSLLGYHWQNGEYVKVVFFKWFNYVLSVRTNERIFCFGFCFFNVHCFLLLCGGIFIFFLQKIYSCILFEIILCWIHLYVGVSAFTELTSYQTFLSLSLFSNFMLRISEFHALYSLIRLPL